jgi:hypothetical protein
VGRSIGLSIMITHKATHRLCSNSSPRETFLSWPKHRTLRTSLRATFGCSHSEDWTLFQTWRASIECDGRATEDSKRSLLPVLPTTVGSMEWVCVCVCGVIARTRVLLWRWLGKRCRMSYHYSTIKPFREHFDCPNLIDRYPTPISVATLNNLNEVLARLSQFLQANKGTCDDSFLPYLLQFIIHYRSTNGYYCVQDELLPVPWNNLKVNKIYTKHIRK